MSENEKPTVTESTPPINRGPVGETPKVNPILDDEDFMEEHEESAPEEKKIEPVEEKKTDDTDYIIQIDTPTLDQVMNEKRPVFVPFPKDSRFSPGLAILPTSKTEYERIFSQIDLEKLPDSDINWLQKSGIAAQSSYEQDTYLDASTRKGSNWTSLIDRENLKAPLGMRRDKFKSVQGGNEVSGSEAVDLFMAGSNLGRSVNIPLWHSGFWIKMQAPSAAYLAEIDRAIAFSKEELGLDIFGAIGSNDRLLFDETLIDAALKLVVRSSLPISKSPLELKDYISSLDVDALIWGMAVAAYPDGCDVAIPCTSCRHIGQVKANVMRMNFVDESRLTNKQLEMMSAGYNTKATPETLEAYRAEFEITNSTTFTYNHNRFVLKAPTITEYLSSGRQYIAGVGRSIFEVLKEDFTDDTKRANALSSMLSAEDSCRYSHFVERINMGSVNDPDNQSATTTDPTTIVQILRVMSGDSEAASNFTDAINTFISDNTVTIIGFPNVACPSCGKLHLSSAGESTIVIPFNPAVGFFTLAQRKIMQAGGQTLTELSMLGVNALLQKVSVNMELG